MTDGAAGAGCSAPQHQWQLLEPAARSTDPVGQQNALRPLVRFLREVTQTKRLCRLRMFIGPLRHACSRWSHSPADPANPVSHRQGCRCAPIHGHRPRRTDDKSRRGTSMIFSFEHLQIRDSSKFFIVISFWFGYRAGARRRNGNARRGTRRPRKFPGGNRRIPRAVRAPNWHRCWAGAATGCVVSSCR